MKIALVTMRTDPSRGGAERYTVDLARALSRMGHQIALLAASFGGVPEGVTSVRINAGGVTRVQRYRRFLRFLDRHLEASSYDVVHAMLPVRRCDLYHPHAGVARANVRNDRAMTRLFNPRRRFVAQVESHLLESSKPPMVLCLSEYVRAAVRQVYRLDDTLLPILFNAVDLDKFDRRRRPGARVESRRAFGFLDDDCVALFLGQDFERKGLREAIEGLARARLPRLKLLVLGRLAPAEYRRLAARLGVQSQVVMPGYTKDAYASYAGADFLVLPTRHDPCSLVVLEAIAMGVPVISTRFNGACEIMADGVHGRVLPDPADVGALSRAMAELSDDSTRHKMSEACLTLRPQLSYDKHLDTLLRVYDRVRVGRA